MVSKEKESGMILYNVDAISTTVKSVEKQVRNEIMIAEAHS